MSLVLMRADIDRWKPGQHTGMFRDDQLAFVGARAALRLWRDAEFTATLAERARQFETLLHDVVRQHPEIELRGRGFLWGLDFTKAGGPAVAAAVGRRAFQDGLIIERCGRDDVVVKLLPIVIDAETLQSGCAILANAVAAAVAKAPVMA
jgi:diaminobutyrate-2-oxoglutarate transaminase